MIEKFVDFESDKIQGEGVVMDVMAIGQDGRKVRGAIFGGSGNFRGSLPFCAADDTRWE